MENFKHEKEINGEVQIGLDTSAIDNAVENVQAEEEELSELKLAIREMIVGELTEAGEKTAFINNVPTEYRDPKDLEKFKDNPDVVSIKTASGKVVKEDQLNEFAAFYKIKDDVDKEEAKAAIDKAIRCKILI